MAPALLTIALALTVTALTAAAASGRLPVNDLVGIRTGATRRSEAAWRAGHRAALRVVVPAGALTVVLCVVALIVTPSGSREPAGIVLLVAYTLAVVASAVVAHRAAQAQPASR